MCFPNGEDVQPRIFWDAQSEHAFEKNVCWMPHSDYIMYIM